MGRADFLMLGIKSFLGMAVMAMLALSPATAQQVSSPDDDHLIVPGQRIGPVKIGASAQDYATRFVMGKSCDWSDPGDVKGKKVITVLCFYKGSVSVSMTTECADSRSRTWVECRILEAFVIDDPQYATAEGLRVGVRDKQVRDVLGEPSRIISRGKDAAHSLLYVSGILFYVSDKPGDDNQRVTQIYVRPRNCLEDVPCT